MHLKDLFTDLTSPVRNLAKFPSPKCSNGGRSSSGGSTQNQRRIPTRNGRTPSSGNRPRGRSIQQVLNTITNHPALKIVTNVAKSVARSPYMLESPQRRVSSSPERLFCEGYCREWIEDKPKDNKLVVCCSDLTGFGSI